MGATLVLHEWPLGTQLGREAFRGMSPPIFGRRRMFGQHEARRHPDCSFFSSVLGAGGAAAAAHIIGG